MNRNVEVLRDLSGAMNGEGEPSYSRLAITEALTAAIETLEALDRQGVINATGAGPAPANARMADRDVLMKWEELVRCAETADERAIQRDVRADHERARVVEATEKTRADSLEADCAALRAALEGACKIINNPGAPIAYVSHYGPKINAALATDSGKRLLEENTK